MLEMKNIVKQWKGHENRKILKDVNLEIPAGRSIGVMGPSGCGKSTLAKILLCLEPADEGEIIYDGVKLNLSNKKQMKHYRRRVQYISQHPESFFDPGWKLGDSIREAASIHQMKKMGLNEAVSSLLQAVRLNEAVLNRYPYQVSGGEIQRAALCRALLLDPEVLILDEATSMLDISVQAQILRILKEIQRKRNLSFLFISHEIEAVKWFSDEILELKEGIISRQRQLRD